ncbi:MAG: hypothetical protein AAF696_22430 [Bacteroidota bacterium]
MKHLYFFSLFLLLHSIAFSQNHLFIPFGQSEAEVRSFLNSRDYVTEVVKDDKMKRLRAVLEEDKHVEYAFNKGRLYATSVTRNYPDKKSAKNVQRKCLEYMEVTGTNGIKEVNNNNFTCHTVVTDSRVIKLFIIEHPKSKTLTFTAVSRKFGPMISKKDYYYEIDLFDDQLSAKP